MRKETILVVDDEEDILELIRYNLSREGFDIICAESGEKALERANKKSIDLIVLDLMLPGLDGLEVAKQLRSYPKTQGIPIIMLTAKGEEADIVTGLELGADDYITKPFSPRILLARIKAVLRRQSKQPENSDDIIQIHELTIHPGRREVILDGSPVLLTYTEFQVLYYLAKRPGWVLTRSQIVDAVRGNDYPVTDRSVDVQNCGAKKKIGQVRKIHSNGPGRGISIQGNCMKKRVRLIWQLYPSYLVLILAALFAVSWYASRSLDHFSKDGIKEDLRARGQLLTYQIRHYISPLNKESIDRLCKELGARATTRITVILPDGQVVGDSDEIPRHMNNHGNRPEVMAALKGDVGTSIRYSNTLQKKHDVCRDTVEGGKPGGYGYSNLHSVDIHRRRNILTSNQNRHRRLSDCIFGLRTLPLYFPKNQPAH